MERIPPYKVDYQGIYYQIREESKFSPIDFVDGKIIFMTPHIVQERRQWRSHQNDYLEAYHSFAYGKINAETNRDISGKRITTTRTDRLIA